MLAPYKQTVYMIFVFSILYCSADTHLGHMITYPILYKDAFHSKFKEGIDKYKNCEREKIFASFDSVHHVEGLYWRKPTLFAVVLFFLAQFFFFPCSLPKLT